MTQIQALENMSQPDLVKLIQTERQQHADDMDMLSKELAERPHAKINRPMAIGCGRFGVGIKASTVLDAAARHYEFVTDETQERERIKHAMSLIDSLLKCSHESTEGTDLACPYCGGSGHKDDLPDAEKMIAPEGYKLVPIEPSNEMLERAVAFALNVQLSGNYGWTQYMLDLWATMLVAYQTGDVKDSLVPREAPAEWIVSLDGRSIQSTDFTHDVMLTISGDFESDDQRRAYSRQLAEKLSKAKSIPEGWKLVPLEPTNKQVCKMALEVMGFDEHGVCRTDNPHWPICVDKAHSAYKAMLAAAPSPPVSDPQIVRVYKINDTSGLVDSDLSQPCTCPSGNGSLRWPCPVHPPETANLTKSSNQQVTPLHKDEWIKQCAKRFMARACTPKDAALEMAESCHSNMGDNYVKPRDAADEEMSYWDE